MFSDQRSRIFFISWSYRIRNLLFHRSVFVVVVLVLHTLVLVLVEEGGSEVSRGKDLVKLKYLSRTSVVNFRSFFNNLYKGGLR